MAVADSLRLGIADAAARLGVSPDTVRRKLKRGQITGQRDNHGQWWIELPADAKPPVPRQRAAYEPMPEPGTLLLDELRSQISRLRSELDLAYAREESGREALTKVSVLEALLAAEQARVEEWKSVADRFASQAEALAVRRTWWPFRRAGGLKP